MADSCTDSIRNGSETAQDCGGSCPACTTGEACGKAGDCESWVCTANKCAAATCSDGVKNGSESDKDCGKGCAAQLFDVYLSLTEAFPATPTVEGVSALPRNTVTFHGNQAVVARYVKFVLTKNHPQSHWSIQELTLGA